MHEEGLKVLTLQLRTLSEGNILDNQAACTFATSSSDLMHYSNCCRWLLQSKDHFIVPSESLAAKDDAELNIGRVDRT